ncbi:MAG: glycosyltransferase family 87 protein [Candidatus Thorarchaeota archaeon]
MIRKRILPQIKERIKILWGYKIFKYTLLIHGGYFIASIFLTLFLFREMNDFLVYYEVGGVVLRDINDLYIETYNWPFRYFPLSALYFVLFYLMGFDLGFIIFNFINLILNIVICILLYKIINFVKGGDHESDDKRIILYVCLYMISLPQIFNYILGQVNLYVTLLILLSLYVFLKYSDIKWQLIASFTLGLSIVIKPITIFMIPFLFVVQFDLKKRLFKFNFIQSITRLVGVIIPLFLNLIIFIIFPRLIQGFLATNFTSSEPSQVNHSFSITKLIINFFYYMGFNENQVLFIQLPLFLIILIIFGVTALLSFIIRRNVKHSILYGFSFGILVMLICYYDSWDHHLLNLIPLLMIILFALPKRSEITKKFIKPSFFFLSFLDLAFMGLYFLIMGIFPFNFASTIFLLLSFYGIIKYLNSKKNKNSLK